MQFHMKCERRKLIELQNTDNPQHFTYHRLIKQVRFESEDGCRKILQYQMRQKAGENWDN